jgi:DNA-directed RNA polymerase subunit RPC12/RpoP
MKQAIDIFFKCPACGKDLVVDNAGAGVEINCPVCNEKILIPKATQSSDTRLPGSAFFPQDRIAVVCKMFLCCKHFSVPADMAGRTVKCPCCERDVQVPHQPEASRVERHLHAKVVLSPACSSR